ncbi:MAG TPA: YfhO family protein [Candidatus Hydrogenedentes bacterium]|nr:YfhO family protein [Candidatus Hydrogenedentota bacterium]HPC15886.1 YfhO family protein [Candidatus Hydrogenedentota bacterium]HRT19840.1 YfhO family protein [Candidatus Hydrogenedentota bacterium]HRT65420.1 YfhO family protein [Candidatus Hydrogenedentota bacterium]
MNEEPARRSLRFSSVILHPSSCILAGAAAILAVLAYPLFTGRVYTYSDLGAYHLPLRAFYNECLRQGFDFAWMPSILCGYYVHAEGQAGMYHPLHWLLYRFLALEPAFVLECVMAYPFMFAGTVLFLRRWRLPMPACLFGASLFTFGGFNLLHSMHINALQVISHIPWLLALVDVSLRGKNPRARRMAAAGVALLSASQWLLGFPQAVYFSALAEGPYALFAAGILIRGGESARVVVARLAWLAFAKGTGMAIGAVQWIPTLDMLAGSERAQPSPAFSFSLSLEPKNLLQFIGPYFFTEGIYAGRMSKPTAVEFGLYNGAAATALAAWALGMLWGSRNGRRASNSGPTPSEGVSAVPLACAAFVFGAFALLMAFGEHAWVYPFVSKLPFLRSFRGAARHIVLVHLSLAVLGAFAFAGLNRPPGRAPAGLLAGLVAASWILAGLLAIRFQPLQELYASCLAPMPAWFIGPVLITLAAILVLASSRGSRIALAALVLFATGDQALYGLHFVWPSKPQTLSEYIGQFPPPPVAGARLYQHEANAFSLRNIDNCGGYTGVDLRTRLTYDVDHPAALRLAGVRWATRVPQRPHIKPEWIELRHVLPRVRLVTETLQSDNLERDIQGVDLFRAAFVERPLALPDGLPGTILRTASHPGYYRIEAEASSRQLLVLAASYHQGWRATVDGKHAVVERVNGDFMGCVIEPGIHAVEFRFDPESLAMGKRVSGLGLAVLACMLAAAATARTSMSSSCVPVVDKAARVDLE